MKTDRRAADFAKKIMLLFFFLVVSVLICPVTFSAQDENRQLANKENQYGYIIGSSDILEISTWKEPDFSREEVLVRPDGKISFPLLGDIQAAGLTPTEFSKKIEINLKKYIENPTVTIHIIDPQSKKIFILGEVEETGEYPLRQKMSVLQAIAIAGGFTEWASKKEIILLRNENGQEKRYEINFERIVDGKDISQNLQLKSGDTIIVP